jgi:hypothetical protein
MIEGTEAVDERPPAEQAKPPKAMTIRLQADWYSWSRGMRQPHPCDKTHGPKRCESHANLSKVQVEKKIAADNLSKRAGNMDQQQ